MEASLSHVQPMKLCVASYVAVLAGKYIITRTSQPSKECPGEPRDLAFLIPSSVQGIATFI